MEETLSIIKPNAFKNSGKILTILQESFDIVNMKMFTFTREQATIFYEEHKERDTFSQLVEFMSSGPSIALILKRQNAIKEHRNIMKKIRELYSENFMKNAIHGSDSTESAQREIKYIFKELEKCKVCEESKFNEMSELVDSIENCLNSVHKFFDEESDEYNLNIDYSDQDSE